MALVGYARVSTDTQDLAPQLDALAAAGCERVFSEVISSTVLERPQLTAALDYLREGDVLVVQAVDRLSRRMMEFLSIVQSLGERGIQLRSLAQGFDTSTMEGRMVMNLFATFAELEREQISKRTKAGQAAARARGRHPGRPAVLTEERLLAIAELHRREVPAKDIAATLAISLRSVTRGLSVLRDALSPS